MSVPVTVDSDDLEALLFCTAAIKSVEAALKAQSNDPLYEQAKPRLTAAHDRIANLWRGAVRQARTPATRDATAEEVIRLLELAACHGGKRILRTSEDPREWREMQSCGWVELGAEINTVSWGASGEVTQGRPPLQWVRLRMKGHEAIAKAEPEA
jgi:hypothetical protein